MLLAPVPTTLSTGPAWHVVMLGKYLWHEDRMDLAGGTLPLEDTSLE